MRRASPRPASELRGAAARWSARSRPSGTGCWSAPPGTHPFALCDEQRIVERDRYRQLVADLGFIARRELIFGTHVHVGIDGPDKAIYVADGIRRYLPLLLALSTNSPFWEGVETGHEVGADPGLPRLPAGRRAAPLRQLGDLSRPGRRR